MNIIGKMLNNRYEILEEIGSGGMANVYKAKCHVLNRFVAIKVLKPDFEGDQDFIRRFNVEAQAAAAISHPNIVGIYDVGNDNGIHYIVMELIDGITLQEYIEKNGKLSWQETVDFTIQICLALECAHNNNIIHRDIKPHNIIVTSDNNIKVTDFGIARAATTSTITMNTNTMGSVHYFSPEQAKGAQTDQRSDIYSLGVSMYQMLTGVLPFDGDSPVAIAIKHIQEDPISPKEFNIAMPLSVEAIVLKAMSKDKKIRYQSATEMLHDLRNLDNTRQTAVFDSDFHTKIVNTMEVNNILEDANSKKEEIKSENKEQNNNKKVKTEEEKKSDKKAVIWAIITSVILIFAIGFGAWAVLMPKQTEVYGQTEIPNVVGKNYDDIKSELEEKQIFLEIIQSVESDEPAGTILSQDPKAKKDFQVTLPLKISVTVSAEKTKFILEQYANQELAQAKLELQELGLNVTEEAEYSDSIPQGIVIRTNPSAGNEVKKGSKITIYYSAGPERQPIKMPNLIGLDVNNAKKIITSNNLTIGKISYTDDAAEKDTVIEQSEAYGSEVAEYTEINLLCSTGKNSGENTPAVTPTPNNNNNNNNTAVSKTIYITIPTNTEQTTVKILQNGNEIYNKTHTSKDGTIPITIKGNGEQKIDLYFNGVLQSSQKITL